MIWCILPFVWGGLCVAQEKEVQPASLVQASEVSEAKAQEANSAAKILPVFENEKEAKKAFKARRKQINKLVKQYKKASAEQKPLVKEKLYQIVSESMDLGLSSMKTRIALQKANLARWESKLAESEAQWDELKAQRVEDLLSGAAERKYKLAKKAWKQEMKDRKKQME